MMQGLVVIGLIIVAWVIYCVSTLLTAFMLNSIEDGDEERFAFLAWLVGCVLFEMVVMLWGMGEPFPISLK